MRRKLDAAKKYIYERLEDGRFQPKIAKTFSFAQVVEAYQYLESSAQIGIRYHRALKAS
ncbi:zinc-binding dehydrogenase [Alloacidobacterium dinghuense]|uniref:Zinc-binding dehydrogenase n=1 Tax=Alloacidobacterium dinghuense TaxID=2763107 RepID=A0A7G8BFJ7_9BACT|nr:zinc-binding dehydrogenase [Alloacidobacterium dinghuense]QNI31317.1 zinc-binding dehydrogenase [Alloacidobacterium dinghuense]